ncbi:MAG: hypothetical protein ABIB97_02505 [Patescibacteria group bacterium]
MVFIIVFIALMMPQQANASVGSQALNILGNIIAGLMWPIIWLFGNMTRLMIFLLIQVAKYNDFANSTAVNIGWYLVRDIANLFFVIVLLIIAVSTVLGIQSWSYRSLLGKFILMVILINFSKLIALFFIDLSQVIMLTFVEAFEDTMANNIFAAGGFNKLLHMGTREVGESQGLSIAAVLGSTILATIMVVVMFIVLTAMTIMLLIRIIMLWLLIIISPLAYMTATIPTSKKFSSQWWGMFGQYLMIGPVMAFFIWLSMMLIAQTQGAPSTEILDAGVAEESVLGEQPEVYGAITEISESGNFLSYGMAIILLTTSMIFAQQSGVMGSGIAGKALGAIQKTTMAPFKTAGGIIKYGHNKLYGKTGVQLNPMALVRGVQDTLKKRERDDLVKGAGKAGARLERGGLPGVIGGFFGAGRDAAEAHVSGFLGIKGIVRAVRVARHAAPRVAKVREGLEAKQAVITQNSDDLGANYGKAFDSTHAERQTMWDRHDDLEREYPQLEQNVRDAEAAFAAAEATGTDKEIQKASDKLDEAEADESANKAERKGLAESAGPRDLLNQDEELVKKEVETRKGVLRTLNQEANKVQSYLDRIQPPRAFYATRERRMLEEEEAGKIDSTNEDELIQMFRNAHANGDMVQAAAIFRQATKAGHFNEIINHGARARKDWWLDKHGGTTDKKADGVKQIVWQGGLFPSSAGGPNAFFRDVMQGQMKMGEQHALSLQNDLSSYAEAIGHWGVAGQMIGAKDGKLFQRTEPDRLKRCDGESGKKDTEGLMRHSSRLLLGGETVDPFDPSKREHTLSPLGVSILKRTIVSTLSNLPRGRFNENQAAALVTPRNLKIMREVAATIPDSDVLKYNGRRRKTKELLEEMIRGIQRYAATSLDKSGEEMDDLIESIDGLKDALPTNISTPPKAKA